MIVDGAQEVSTRNGTSSSHTSNVVSDALEKPEAKLLLSSGKADKENKDANVSLGAQTELEREIKASEERRRKKREKPTGKGKSG